MSSRARIFATVTLLIGCLAGPVAWAQAQNLEAGKSASQLFAGTCTACHKSPRGLLKTVSPGSLAGFLREHYTTSGDMASQLATYLISNGASDSRQVKQGADKPGADKQGGNEPAADRQGRRNRNASPQEAARPDDAPPPADGARPGRKRLTRPGEPPDEAKPVANTSTEPATERGPDGRRLSAKQRGKLAKPGTEEPSIANEPPKTEAPKTEAPKTESAKTESGKTESGKAEPAKTEPAKPESGTDDTAKVEPKEDTRNADRANPDVESKPGNEAKSEPAKIETPTDGASGDKPVARRDPAPAATPAAAAASVPTPAPAVASGGSSEPAARQPAPAAGQPHAVTASAPQPAPAGGPPAPPISR